VPKGEGRSLVADPDREGFRDLGVKSCRDRGRRRMVRDSLDRSSWVELQENEDHAWERLTMGWEWRGGVVDGGSKRSSRDGVSRLRLACLVWRLPFLGSD
jgi:hypothetical protein